MRLRYGLLLTLLCLAPLTSRAEDEKLDFERLSIDQGLAESSVRAVLQDRRGFLWLATKGGLNRWDGHSFLVFKQRSEDPASLSDNSVHTLFEDASDTLWIGTFNGLDRFDSRTRRFRHAWAWLSPGA